jgi:hypothetical protein
MISQEVVKMISLNEMFFYTLSNWGEKTPRSVYSIGDNNKTWSVMKDSNLLVRDEGIETFNSEKNKVEV